MADAACTFVGMAQNRPLPSSHRSVLRSEVYTKDSSYDPLTWTKRDKGAAEAADLRTTHNEARGNVPSTESPIGRCGDVTIIGADPTLGHHVESQVAPDTVTVTLPVDKSFKQDAPTSNFKRRSHELLLRLQTDAQSHQTPVNPLSHLPATTPTVRTPSSAQGHSKQDSCTSFGSGYSHDYHARRANDRRSLHQGAPHINLAQVASIDFATWQAKLRKQTNPCCKGCRNNMPQKAISTAPMTRVLHLKPSTQASTMSTIVHEDAVEAREQIQKPNSAAIHQALAPSQLSFAASLPQGTPSLDADQEGSHPCLQAQPRLTNNESPYKPTKIDMRRGTLDFEHWHDHLLARSLSAGNMHSAEWCSTTLPSATPSGPRRAGVSCATQLPTTDPLTWQASNPIRAAAGPKGRQSLRALLASDTRARSDIDRPSPITWHTSGALSESDIHVPHSTSFNCQQRPEAPDRLSVGQLLNHDNSSRNRGHLSDRLCTCRDNRAHPHCQRPSSAQTAVISSTAHALATVGRREASEIRPGSTLMDVVRLPARLASSAEETDDAPHACTLLSYRGNGVPRSVLDPIAWQPVTWLS